MSDSTILPTAQTAAQQMTTSGAPLDQFIRRVNLTVYSDKDGHGLDLSQMRIKFQVRRATSQTANELIARVYNRDSGPERIQPRGPLSRLMSVSNDALTRGLEEEPNRR